MTRIRRFQGSVFLTYTSVVSRIMLLHLAFASCDGRPTVPADRNRICRTVVAASRDARRTLSNENRHDSPDTTYRDGVVRFNVLSHPSFGGHHIQESRSSIISARELAGRWRTLLDWPYLGRGSKWPSGERCLGPVSPRPASLRRLHRIARICSHRRVTLGPLRLRFPVWFISGQSPAPE